MPNILELLGQFAGNQINESQDNTKKTNQLVDQTKTDAMTTLNNLVTSYKQGYAQSQPNQNGPITQALNANQENAIDPFSSYQQKAAHSELTGRYSKDAENMSNEMLLKFATPSLVQSEVAPTNNKQDSGGNSKTPNSTSSIPTPEKDSLLKTIFGMNNAGGQPGVLWQLLNIGAGGGFVKAQQTPGQESELLQKLMGETPLQKSEKQKMLATAAFDTTKLTNESITASATAFDKIYTTLSGPEKAGLWLGKVPKRLESISSQLQAAATQQGASFVSRSKAAQELQGNSRTGGGFEEKAAAAGYSQAEIKAYLKGKR